MKLDRAETPGDKPPHTPMPNRAGNNHGMTKEEWLKAVEKYKGEYGHYARPAESSPDPAKPESVSSPIEAISDQDFDLQEGLRPPELSSEDPIDEPIPEYTLYRLSEESPSESTSSEETPEPLSTASPEDLPVNPEQTRPPVYGEEKQRRRLSNLFARRHKPSHESSAPTPAPTPQQQTSEQPTTTHHYFKTNEDVQLPSTPVYSPNAGRFFSENRPPEDSPVGNPSVEQLSTPPVTPREPSTNAEPQYTRYHGVPSSEIGEPAPKRDSGTNTVTRNPVRARTPYRYNPTDTPEPDAGY